MKKLFVLLLLLTGCIEVGSDSSDGLIQGKVLEERALNAAEIAEWADQAECMEQASKASAEIKNLNATQAPIVNKITIRQEVICDNRQEENLVACHTQNEIAIRADLSGDQYYRIIRHEAIHCILLLLTGSNDKQHRTIWFDPENNPCPETDILNK